MTLADLTTTDRWYCFAASVTGASHRRKNPPLPNQDAYAIRPSQSDRPAGNHWVLVVADGHGSAKSFRSDVGSRLAVETAATYLWECFCEEPTEQPTYEAIHDFCKTQLPERLVRLWVEAVKTHLTEHPFSEAEEQLLPTHEELRVPSPTPQFKRLDLEQLRTSYAYGSTLLAVVITDRFLLYLQIGDGDIICVDSSGNSDRPFPKDPNLIANETTSLCLANAWQYFQVKLIPLQSHSPALIFVSTDGYSNSFPTEEDYLETVRDYRRWLQEQVNLGGSEQAVSDRIHQDLSDSLSDVSEQGSGDDITVGLLAPLTWTEDQVSSPNPLQQTRPPSARRTRQMQRQLRKISRLRRTPPRRRKGKRSV